MTELDRLPPDQRAVLSLVLERGRSYAEVAQMLAIPQSAVRERAHAALDALARGAVGGEGTPVPPSLASPPPSSPLTTPSSVPPPSSSAPPRGAPALPSSRLGGGLLLGGIVAVIAVVAIVLSSGGGKSGGTTTSTTNARPSSTAATTTSAGKPSLNKTIALSPLDPSLKATGTAYVLSESGRRAFYVAARGLPPSQGFFYAVWLYNSPSSSAALGRAPTVGSDGRMEGGGPLPTNAGIFHELIVTRETSTHPRRPGAIVLRGRFALQ
jgi:hypothetical protein